MANPETQKVICPGGEHGDSEARMTEVRLGGSIYA